METINTLPVITTGLKKSEIAALASSAVDSLLESGNQFEVAEALSAMEDFVKQVKSDQRYISYLRDELTKTGGKLTTPSGAKIEVAEVGTSYDFTNCGDIELTRMEEELKRSEEAVKNRRDFLKTVTVKGMVVTDTETGETYTVYPPVKTSKSSYKVSLAK
jgi:hypothetical protein